MSNTAISEALTALVAAVIVFAKAKGLISEQYDALVASGLALLSQIVLVIIVQKPELSNPVLLIINLLIAILGAIGATKVPAAFRQARLAFTKK